ncbi:MAG: response regulator [Bryobacteraceae bacterium]|jgi:PAS domain S-box-containing protein
MSATRILIVEDEGLIALDLKKKLEQVGYTVPAIADSAASALLSVESLEPSLVLMDIRLRGPRDGIDTADQIRRRFHVPVVFVTAHADRETLDRARITEPFGYIVKPFHSVDFRAQIEIALWKHKMEQKLRAGEAWLATIFRNVADALIATGEEGNITYMNAPAAALTGWDCEASKGRPLPEIFEAFEEATNLPMVNTLEAVGRGEAGVGPCAFKLTRRGDPEPVLVEAEFSANRDEGLLLGIIVVFRDITRRRQAEKQRLQLQKMNSLALMAIGLGRELAESQSRMDDSLKELIARSQGSTLRLLGDVYECSARQQSVVQKLVTLGKTEPGQSVVVDVNEVLTKLEPKFRKALGARRSLNLKPGPGLPLIRADVQDLRENLFRLVIESRDATPDGGAVEVSTTVVRSSDGKDGARVAIRDNGKGIRPDSSDRVFDPYYQSRPGRRNPGFSLALVYQFVALSGGCIEVQSAPGDGTAYLLTFPAADASQTPPSPVKELWAAAAESSTS